MDADRALERIRLALDGLEGAPLTERSVRQLLDQVASQFRQLDTHLCMGGTPPEAWREGPDAPELDDAGEEAATEILARYRPARDDDASRPARDDDYTAEAIDRDAVLAPLTGPQASMPFERVTAIDPRDWGFPAEPLGPPNPAGVELP